MLRAIPGTALRSDFWWGLKIHLWCKELNQVSFVQDVCLNPCTLSLFLENLMLKGPSFFYQCVFLLLNSFLILK